VEGLRVGLEIEEIPDRRERSGMGHVQSGHGWDLVVGSIFQRTVELPDVPGLVRRGEHTLVESFYFNLVTVTRNFVTRFLFSTSNMSQLR